MAFQNFSAERAALTFARENENFDRMFSTGVYSGMQVYPDSLTVTNEISIMGGYCVINGVLWYDDQDNVEIIDLGAVVDPTGDHHIIWLDVSSGSPVYSVKTGTYGAPAQLTGVEKANGLKLADVWIPNGAANIQSAVISNVDRVRSNQELYELISQKPAVEFEKAKVVQAGSVFTLHFAAALIHINDKKEAQGWVERFPVSWSRLQTATTSTEFGAGYYELGYDTNGNDRYVVFYTRDETDFADPSTFETLTVEVMGFEEEVSFESGDTELALMTGSAQDPVDEAYPNRRDTSNIRILAIVNVSSGSVYLQDAGVMPVGVTLDAGAIDQYVSSLSSTIYGTGPITRSGTGDVDIDNVIDNAAKLHNGTLDTVYDGLENGSSPGDGRIITVDAGPLEINREGISLATPDDQLYTSIKVNMNYDSSGGAGDEVAFQALASEDRTGRKGFMMREHLYIAGKTCVAQSSNFYDGGSGRVACSQFGTITASDWITNFGPDHSIEAITVAENFAGQVYISFDGVGAATHRSKIYRLNFDGFIGGSGAWWVEDLDGTTNVQAEFPAVPFSEDVTLWIPASEMSHESRFHVVRPQEISPFVDGLPVTANDLRMRTQYDRVKDFLSRAGQGDVAVVSSNDEPLGSSATFKAAVSYDKIFTDGFYMYGLINSGVGTNLTIQCIDMDSGTVLQTMASSNTVSDANQGLITAWRGRYLWVAYDEYIDIFEPGSGTKLAGPLDYSGGGGEKIYDIVSVNGICYAGGQVAAAGPYNLATLNSTSITGTATLGSTSEDIWHLDVINKRLFAIADDGLASPSKQSLYYGNFGYLTTSSFFDLSNLPRTVDGMVGGDGDIAVSERYVAIATTTNSALDSYIDFFEITKTPAIGAVGTANAPIHRWQYRLPVDQGVEGLTLHFGHNGVLYVAFYSSFYARNILLAIDPITQSTLWYDDSALASKRFVDLTTDNMYMYASDLNTNEIAQFSMGVRTGLWRRLRSDDHKLLAEPLN